MKLCLLWDIEIPIYDLVSWQDGLYWALSELGKKHEVEIILKSDQEIGYRRDNILVNAYSDDNFAIESLYQFSPDNVILWGQINQPLFERVKESEAKVGLCFAGGAEEHPRGKEYDIIFTENKYINQKFIDQGYNAKVAFGINTDIFKPYPQPKIFKALYPAVFGMWKRQDLFAQAFGKDGVCIGRYQPHEPQCLQWAQDAGCMTVPIILSQSAMPYFYNASECIVSTATNDSGGQRTVLEAMACNVPVIVMSDNYKACEYIGESKFGDIAEPDPKDIKNVFNQRNIYANSRQYVLDNWTHLHYAKEIEKWLLA